MAFSMFSFSNFKAAEKAVKEMPTLALRFYETVFGMGTELISSSTSYLIHEGVNQCSSSGKSKNTSNGTTKPVRQEEYMSTMQRYRIIKGIV